MNYGNLINNKIYVWTFQQMENVGCLEMYLCTLGLFCIIHLYFYCIDRSLCPFLYIGIYFEDVFYNFLKCPEV